MSASGRPGGTSGTGVLLPGTDPEPVFSAPWEATAFAMVVRLVEQGWLTWPEWARTLGRHLPSVPTEPGPAPSAGQRSGAPAGERTEEGGRRYYECWLDALEELLVARGVCTPGELDALREAWAEAARQTPHGEPILLERGRPPEERP